MGVFLLIGLGASPASCPSPLPYPSSFVACDCHGDLAASNTGHSYMVTQTYTCGGSPRDGWVDIYRVNFGGSDTHIAYCTFNSGYGVPAQPCVIEDYSPGDYYTATVGLTYDSNNCGGLYNDAVDSP